MLYFQLLISKGLNFITYPTPSPPDSQAFDVGEVEVHREVQICQQVQGERKTRPTKNEKPQIINVHNIIWKGFCTLSHANIIPRS